MLSPDFLDALATPPVDTYYRLLPNEKPASVPLVNSDVELALSTVLEAIRKRSGHRVACGGSPPRVSATTWRITAKRTRETVEHYTVVLAATCQQAVGYI